MVTDPIFGEINKVKILNAEKIIRNHRIEEDPAYKKSIKQFNEKIRHPVTDLEFALRAEDQKVKDCESLVSKMS